MAGTLVEICRNRFFDRILPFSSRFLHRSLYRNLQKWMFNTRGMTPSPSFLVLRGLALVNASGMLLLANNKYCLFETVFYMMTILSLDFIPIKLFDLICKHYRQG